MQPVVLKPDVYWVGAVDFNLRDFHHYTRAPLGSTYNAYLIKDEKTVLVDCVSHDYAPELIKRISEITDPCKIDYFICNHLEQDHAGVLQEMVALCKPEKIFCSAMGVKSMTGQFNTEGWPIQAVKDGESINIGRRNITFFETKMLHWPDSMVSWLAEDKILITNDAFGQNIGTSYRFADEIDNHTLLQAIREYYYNIVLPFSPQVIKVLDRLQEVHLPIDIIAPDHGLIYRKPEDVALALGTYRELAEQKPKKRAVIAYDSMWHATETMARSVADGLNDEGVEYTLLNMNTNHPSHVMAELATSGALLLGSPTRNNMPMVTMMGLLAHIKGLRPKNLVGAAFGSHGWSGEAPKMLAESMIEIGIEMAAEPLRISFGPKAEDLARCCELGRTVATVLKSKLS